MTNKILKEAIDTYGEELQLDIAIEEMAELIKELIKYKRYHNNVERIAEETADVEIMLEQIMIIFNIHWKVSEHKINKVERLKERLKK